MNKVFVLLVASILGLTQAGLTGDKDCVLYLSFDRYDGEKLFDNSANSNGALLANGASTAKVKGSCGVCAQLLGGNIKINGKSFHGIPQQQITIAFMIQLWETKGTLRFFETIGDHSTHKLPQYRLESEDGTLIWFHRNQRSETVFSVKTDGRVLAAGKWTHVLVTYTAMTGTAQIFIDGLLVKEETRDMGVPLSTDWGDYAGVGRHDGEKNIRAYLDEFYIYNKTLTEMEIKNLISKCSGEKSSVILHLSFDKDTGNMTMDSSGLKNDAAVVGLSPIMTSLAVNGTCGLGLKVPSNTGEIKLDGKTMRNKPTDAVTIALWVNLTSTEGGQSLFKTVGGQSLHTKNQFELGIKDGAIVWMHRNEYGQIVFNVDTAPLILAGTWVHVAGTYSASSGQARIYLNGDLVKEGIGSGSLSEDWGGQASFAVHKGTVNNFVYVDEITMYNRALSPFEVKNLFGKCNFVSGGGNKGFQLIYYGFDRKSGRIIFDDSGNNNDGTVDSLAKVAKSTGKCGDGLQLVGGDISINGIAMKRRPLMAITIMLWVKLETISGDQEVFMTTTPENPGNKHGQYHFQINDGAVRWFHRNAQSQTIFSAVTKEPVVEAGKWTHVSATYQSAKRRAEIYVNGVLKAMEDSGSGTLSQDWNGKVVIGKSYDMADDGQWVESQPLLGVIDEFYILDKALSESEIMSMSHVCNFHRVVLHLGFERSQGMYTLDQSGLGNNGKMVNLTATDMPGVCGLAMNMSQGEIDLDGLRFRGKPLDAISIATWVRLNTNRGYHQLFNTIGSRSEHKHDQYDFAIDNGKVIWAHNDEQENLVFRLETLPVIPARNWSHVVVTYDSSEMLAKIYVGGELRKTKSGSGLLSQDWGHFAGIGRHFYEREYLIGATDEFLMYNYALSETEAQYLAKANCG